MSGLLAVLFGLHAPCALSAEAPLFLEAISAANAFPVSEREVRARIRAAAAEDGAYLSLGETHLYPLLSRPHYQSLAAESLDASRSPVHVCAEDLKDPVEAIPLLAFLRAHAASFWLSPGNSPRTTDFRRCSDPGKKWLLYSGLFHQYPLPRMFPRDFALTPVATEPGNTISTQLAGLRGLFVGGLDLPYLEEEAMEAILRERGPLGSPASFRARVARMQDAIRALQDKMELLPAGLLHGAYFDRRSFLGNPEVRVMPEGAHVLVLDPAFRYRAEAPLFLLGKLAAGEEETLARILALLADPEAKPLVAASNDFLDPATLLPLPFGFGTLPGSHPPGTEILRFRAGEGEIHVLASPGDARVRCFKGPRSEAAVEIPCRLL